MQAEEALKLIMDKKFFLDCPQMLLSPQLSTSSRKSYSGAGFVSQNEEGHFILKIYGVEGLSPFECIEDFFNIKSGEIINEEYYYELSATDISGKQWKAKWIWLDIHSGQPGSVIHGQTDELIYSYQLPKSVEHYFVDIYFPGDIDIPCNTTTKLEKEVDGEKRLQSYNLNIAKFKACGFEFGLEKETDWLNFNILSNKKEITEATIMRFNETLQFVLGRSLYWVVLVVINGDRRTLTVRTSKQKGQKARIGPPIAMQQCRGTPTMVWILFQKYLEYIRDYRENSWHPLSYWIHTVIESGAASFDIERLVLSVAIEGVLKSQFSELKPTDSTLESQINKAKLIILQSDLQDNFKKRVEGALGSMSKPRAKDWLHILKEQGFVRDELVKGYGKLRDSSAHGDLVSGMQMQTDFDQYAAALVLFYHLIFSAINYRGEYTDYSSRNYPLKQFPHALMEIKADC
jgi:hypothetical protein